MRHLICTAFAICVFVASNFVQAAPHQYGKPNAPVISKAEAAKVARQNFGGKVLKVKVQKKQGRQGYQVKLLKPSGHVKHVWIDGHKQ